MSARVFWHDPCDSTNERALESLARGEARHGDVHLAHGQSAGRGQRGRPWYSPEGTGLYASLVWAPERALDPACLTMAGGLAVLDRVRALGVEGAELEWPNDVLVHGAKLAGILVEARGLDPARPRYVVGVGVNVGTVEFPEALRTSRAVTSLALLGHRLTPDALAEELLPELRRRLEQAGTDPDGLCAEFAARTGRLGTAVRVQAPGEELRGELVGVELDRGVGVRRADGSTAWVALAHVRGLRPDGPADAPGAGPAGGPA